MKGIAYFTIGFFASVLVCVSVNSVFAQVKKNDIDLLLEINNLDSKEYKLMKQEDIDGYTYNYYCSKYDTVIIDDYAKKNNQDISSSTVISI